MEIENFIKIEMSQYYGLKLTDDQIKDIRENNNFEHFDTLEREQCIDYVAKKITGKGWPLNGDPDSYKKQFYKELKDKSKKLGYKFE